MPASKSATARRAALDRVAKGKSISATACELGVSETTVRRWMAQADAGSSDLEPKELVELRRRMCVLESRIEFLTGAVFHALDLADDSAKDCRRWATCSWRS